MRRIQPVSEGFRGLFGPDCTEILIRHNSATKSSVQRQSRYGNESPLLAYPVLESIDELLPQNNPYGPLDGVYEAVWRALVRDQILGSGRKEVADYALCFPSLYSKKSKALIDRRSYSVRNSVAIARYFMGHGRALHE